MLLWLAGLSHMPTLELDVEATLIELLPEEGEMGGACEKNSGLFFTAKNFFKKL